MLSPAVVVDYIRDAYICYEGNVRITFDKNLRAGLDFDILNPDIPTVRAMQEGVLVMEVKYDDFLPKYIKTLYSAGRCQPYGRLKIYPLPQG